MIPNCMVRIYKWTVKWPTKTMIIFIAETYGEKFSKPGCMYRGPPPEGKLYQLSPEFQASMLQGQKYSVKFSSFEWTLNDSVNAKVRQKCFDLISKIMGPIL